jgi:outer membrane protein assembly factor BamB
MVRSPGPCIARWKLVALALVAAAGAAPVLACEEWTRFRGPNGSGICEHARFPERVTPADIRWRTRLPGAGHSSPVTWKGRVYLISAGDRPAQRHVVCVEAATGRIRWERSYPFQPYPRHELNSFASSTPAVDARGVYVVLPSPERLEVLALDHEGKERWRRDLGSQQTQHGGAGSPVVAGELLVVRQDQEEAPSIIHGLDVATGRSRWRLDQGVTRAAPYSTPLLLSRAGARPELVFTSTERGFTAVDPATGRVTWELPGVFKARCVSSPVQAGELLVGTAGSGGGDRAAVAVRPPSGGAPAAVAYQIPRGVSYVPTPVSHRGLLFFWGDGGIVTCVRAATGEQVWNERVGGTYYGSPVCVSGRLYAMSSQGELVVIAAAESFRILGRSSLEERSHSTPAIAGDTMYLRTETHLLAVRAQSGDERAEGSRLARNR